MSGSSGIQGGISSAIEPNLGSMSTTSGQGDAFSGLMKKMEEMMEMMEMVEMMKQIVEGGGDTDSPQMDPDTQMNQGSQMPGSVPTYSSPYSMTPQQSSQDPSLIAALGTGSTSPLGGSTSPNMQGQGGTNGFDQLAELLQMAGSLEQLHDS